MPGGMGYGGFGTGPMGAYDWAEEVLWTDVPEQPDRVADADPAQGNGALEGFQRAVMGVFRLSLDKLRNAHQIRDVWTVPTRFQDNLAVEITAAAVEVEGSTVRVTVAGPGAAVDPFDPLQNCSVGWTLTDRQGREFLVDQVHKLTLSLIVVGNSLPALAAVPGVADAWLRAPTLIEHLSNDYGVDSDDNDPEHYQRAAARDAWQWYRRKGAQAGYQIIGDVYGHQVVAEQLWYVGAIPPASIPAADLYEYPAGSGLYYTTWSPAAPLFDEVAADVIPLDLYCWETPLWTTDGIVPPPGPLPDLTPVSEAIGSTMQALPIVSATYVGDPLAVNGIWRIEVAGDLTPIASAGLTAPRWYATFPTGDAADFWLEANPVDIGGGNWTFDVVNVRVGAVWGATANLDYWCDPQPSCDFCAASALKITLVPADVLTETGVIWEQMIPRLVEKVTLGIPIHVRFVLWWYVPPVMAAPFGVAASHFVTVMI